MDMYSINPNLMTDPVTVAYSARTPTSQASRLVPSLEVTQRNNPAEVWRYGELDNTRCATLRSSFAINLPVNPMLLQVREHTGRGIYQIRILNNEFNGIFVHLHKWRLSNQYSVKLCQFSPSQLRSISK